MRLSPHLCCFLFWAIAVCIRAQAYPAVITSPGLSAAKLDVLDGALPSIGSRLKIVQRDLFGELLASVYGEVRSLSGSVVSVRLDGAVALGPVDVELISGDSASPDSRVALGGAVGMQVGNLEPNFTPGGGVVGDDDQADSAAELERVLALVREWISIAEPRENAKPGYRLKFTQWGQFYGSTPTGEISINAKPDDAQGMNYDEFLWAKRTTLASLNHCTLGEFVQARLAGNTLAECDSSAGLARGDVAAVGERVTVGESSDGAERQVLSPNTMVSGRIFPESDSDEFVFTAAHHGQWTFEIMASPAGVELALGVYPAPNGGWIPDMTAANSAVLTVDLPKPAQYILRVFGKHGSMQSELPYRVQALFQPSPDVFEPNNNAQAAVPIEGTGRIVGTILPRREIDEFVFEASHHGEWIIDVTTAPAGVDVRVGIYPFPNGGWLPDMAPNIGGKLVVDLPKPGKYVLRSWAGNGDARSISPYRLTTDFTPSPDQFEPNNTAATATTISGTAYLTGTILPRREVDEFVFETDHHGEWTIDIESEPDGVDLKVGAYPFPNGGWLPDMAAGVERKLVVDLPKPGKYVLRAWAGNGDARSVSPYRLNAGFLPSPDQHESKTGPGLPVPVSVGQQISGTILPRADRDEFQLNVDSPGKVVITTLTSPLKEGLFVGVYPAPNGGWLADLDPDNPHRLELELKKAGVYIIRVNGRSGAERSIAPYRIAVSRE